MLKKRQWVPAPKDKLLTSRNLALVLEKDEELLRMCEQDKPTRFLSVLNISISELMMQVVASEDQKTKLELDKAMGSLFSTFMTNPSQLSKIAQLAKSDPGLFIEEMDERLSIREQIRRNQSIGSLVEKLLKNVLENEGFKVEVTGVGSDFVIEHDFVKDNVETIFEVKKDEKICSYIEVKATSQDFVRMTLTQGKEAKNKIDQYGLCVIPLNGLEINEEDIKNRAKFVMDIGQKIQDKVTKVENFKVEQEAISEVGDIEIEISEGPIRFKINKTVWEDGKTFEKFLEFLRGTKI
jgi:vacuolar-type H+-ATPase subunit I/STV1